MKFKLQHLVLRLKYMFEDIMKIIATFIYLYIYIERDLYIKYV